MKKYLIYSPILVCLLLGSLSPVVLSLNTQEVSASELTTSNIVPSTDGDATEERARREAIIGEDNQFKITDTQTNPYQAIVHLELHFNQGIADGTGVLIAPNLVLTVAHNVFLRSSGEWANKIVVTPAKDGDVAPYGSYTAQHYYMFRNYPTARGIERRENDVAIIKLDTPVPTEVGYLPLATDVSETEILQVLGYPADTASKFGYMYAAFGPISSMTDKTITHLVDTERGNSGSPLLNSTNQIVGLQSSALYDKVTPTSGTENYARRVTEDVLNMVHVAQTNGPLTETITSNREHPILPTGVVLTPADYSLTVGATTTLTATVNPAEATVQSLNWSSSDSTIATVVDGLITAVGPGTATITVTTVSGNHTATAQVSVVAQTPERSTHPLYRLYHPGLKVHLYTKDANEYAVLASRGWKQEGIAWMTAVEQGELIYRLYHPGLKVHLYTKDTNEYKVLATRGWKREGEAFRSYGEVPVYRLYHPGIKKHLYTKDTNEYKVLATRGWKQEGIAFYAVK